MARVTFRVESLKDLGSGGGNGSTIVPVRCWRATFTIATLPKNIAVPVIIDGVNITDTLNSNDATTSAHVWTFVVGGVFDAQGRPILVDKDLRIENFSSSFSGLVVYEDIVP